MSELKFIVEYEEAPLSAIMERIAIERGWPIIRVERIDGLWADLGGMAEVTD